MLDLCCAGAYRNVTAAATLIQIQHTAVAARLDFCWLADASCRCLTAAAHNTDRSTDHISTSFFPCQESCEACRKDIKLLCITNNVHCSAPCPQRLIHWAYHIAQEHMIAEGLPSVLRFRLVAGRKACFCCRWRVDFSVKSRSAAKAMRQELPERGQRDRRCLAHCFWC